MENIMKKIYVKLFEKENKVITSGIMPSEFIKYSNPSIENIILLEANIIGNDYNEKHKFELLEGNVNITKALNEDTVIHGDLCFTDYSIKNNIDELNVDDILHLLYFAHTTEKLDMLINTTIKNNYAYYCHDNGWYSKVYCKDINSYIFLLLNMLSNLFEISTNITDRYNQDVIMLKNILVNGVIIDVSTNTITIYEVGEYSNMDEIYNNYELIISQAINIYTVTKIDNKISICKG